MLIFRETPEETMQYLIEKSRTRKGEGIPLINLEDPADSLIVLKPTAKIPKKKDNGEFEAPADSGKVTHMGGLKMHRDDQSYKSFIAWISDYANVVGDRYTNVKDLPADNWHATRRVIRIKDAPQSWPKGTPVQLFVHSWNHNEQGWSEEPVAFTQGLVTPRKMINGPLFVFGRPGDENMKHIDRVTKALSKGKYLIKTYADFDGKLAENPLLLLGEQEYRGQIEIENAQWRVGFPKAEMVSGKVLLDR